MTFAELTVLLRELLGTGLAAEMHLGIYDPDLDPDGSCARGLVEAISSAFERRES